MNLIRPNGTGNQRMVLGRKINAVNRVYRQVDNHIHDFKLKSGLDCIPGCGTCCLKPDIETTILEALPAAYELYVSGMYIKILEQIENKTDSICSFYNPFTREGFCSMYKNRFLICRLFGFSSRTDKFGNRIMVTCNKIKNNIRSQEFGKMIPGAPEISSYFWKLYGIDPRLSIQYFPVNESIKKALDIVLMNIQYRKTPA